MPQNTCDVRWEDLAWRVMAHAVRRVQWATLWRGQIRADVLGNRSMHSTDQVLELTGAHSQPARSLRAVGRSGGRPASGRRGTGGQIGRGAAGSLPQPSASPNTTFNTTSLLPVSRSVHLSRDDQDCVPRRCDPDSNIASQTHSSAGLTNPSAPCGSALRRSAWSDG
jgi:hypothetical protein